MCYRRRSWRLECSVCDYILDFLVAEREPKSIKHLHSEWWVQECKACYAAQSSYRRLKKWSGPERRAWSALRFHLQTTQFAPIDWNFGLHFVCPHTAHWPDTPSCWAKRFSCNTSNEDRDREFKSEYPFNAFFAENMYMCGAETIKSSFKYMLKPSKRNRIFATPRQTPPSFYAWSPDIKHNAIIGNLSGSFFRFCRQNSKHRKTDAENCTYTENAEIFHAWDTLCA